MTLQSFERALKQPKQSIQTWMLLLLSLVSLLLVSGRLYAVPTFEMFAASGDTTALGPTTGNQTHTYLYNTNNPTGNTVLTVYPQPSVTYSLENQQYTNGLIFGNGVNPRNSFVALGTQGAPINTDFASSRNNPANPQGIDVNSNHGLRMTLVTGRLTGVAQRNTTAVNGGLGYYYGDLVMTWNRPVLNPVINMSGLGGRGGSPTFGFSAGAELFNPPAGTTISRLAGTNLAVTGLTMRNNATTIGATRTTGGASGSVQVLNTNPITTLRFRLYVRSDSTSTSTDWGPNTNDIGEAFVFSSSSVDAVVGDLFVSKTNNVTNVTSGGSTTYTVRVTNNGPSTIDGAILNDVVGTGLSATSAVCSAAASNRCTIAPNLASLVGAGVTLPSLASGQFYEVNVTANVSGSGSVTNSAQISLPASNIASNTGASCVTSGGITRSFNTTTGACTSTDTDTIFVPSPPLQCGSNLYTLQGNTTVGFRNIRTLQPNGTLGALVTSVPANGGAANPNDFNAGMAISPDGSKVFVNTPSGLMRVYDVLTNSWSNGPVISTNISMIRAAITSNGIGYASREDQLWTFQTTPPYTSSGPVTITSINGGPPPTASNGDLFADGNGNLFLLANPLADGTQLNLYRIAANGNSLFLGTLTAPSGQYGGFAAIPAGVYASSAAGNIIRADLSAFTATQTAPTNTARGSSDLASCFYPNLNPVVQALKTATKVAGSAGTDVRAGDTIEYRIAIRNIGTLPAADVRFQDSIPAGTTYVPNSTTYNYTTAAGRPQVALADVGGQMPFVTARNIESPGQSSGILLIDSTGVGTMAPNAADRDREVIITFRVTVNADAAGVTNQGVVTYIDDPGPPTTATVVTDDPTTPEPNDSTSTTISQLDYSDAPASYGAASHTIVDGIRLGATNTAEIAASITNNDAGDDGVTIPALTQGQTATITAEVFGAGGYLNGWIDWNGNGTFDAGEQVVAELQDNAAGDTNPAVGTVSFVVNVPLDAVLTQTFARFRWSTQAGLTPNGFATDGEVEDYAVTVVLGQVNISGRVFTDNGGTDPDPLVVVANAYNGIQNAGEIGIAGSTVQLTNCAANPAPADVLATTQTDGSGDYSFSVLLTQLSTPNFCITQTNLAGYTSVSGTTGYARATDTITIANSGALSYTGHNFGDARLNLVLTTDGQQTTTPSGTVSYPHILRSDAVLDVGTLSTISTENPTLGWTTVLYRDTNCNGVVDAGEQPLTGSIGVLLPEQEICVVQRVNAPATASTGAQHVATLSASYTATVQDSGVLSGSSNTRTDTTLVGTAGLDMRKQVRVVASCPSTGADVAAFSERNTAQHGDFLEYEIIYTNRNTRNLSQVNVRDFVPSSALFKAASCQSTPAGSTCSVSSQPAVDASGAVNWLVTGPVRPAATGSVRFCVQVPPLAEPPIQ